MGSAEGGQCGGHGHGFDGEAGAKLLRKGEPERHFDGNGLYSIVSGKNTGHWERRYELHGKSHWPGLGSCALSPSPRRASATGG